jgi:hypothetical protein
MATLLGTQFTLLLLADSEQSLPDTDAYVMAALDPFGALYKRP